MDHELRIFLKPCDHPGHMLISDSEFIPLKERHDGIISVIILKVMDVDIYLTKANSN